MNVQSFWLERLKKHQIEPLGHHLKSLEPQMKCFCIVHLDMICMGYDQKKGHESNWEFDS
jgi:hypothetical protein